MEHKLIVGIADMKMARDSGMLVTYALGSCIGICLYDPLKKLGAMVHVMLPLNMETGRTNTMKYADTGIRETLRMMESKGAMRSRITAKIAGGAKYWTAQYRKRSHELEAGGYPAFERGCRRNCGAYAAV